MKQPPRYRPRAQPGDVLPDGSIMLADGTAAAHGQIWIPAKRLERARRAGWQPMVRPFGQGGALIEVWR